MGLLKSRNNGRKIIPLKKMGTKGVVTTDLRVKRTLGKNGAGACVYIPQDFIHELKWEKGKTEIYLTLTDKGELLVTPAAQAQMEKAS